MAIDDASKRASVLHAGSFFPGRVPQSKDRDAGDLDDANQRGFVLWHYAGISASTVAAVVEPQTALGHLSGIFKRKRVFGRTFS